jgi:ATP-binding cassette subfamily B (MDR/TAP) protein 1
LFVIPALGFGRVLKDLGDKMQNAYGVAGAVAEQAISSIRTVYSYVGEHQTLNKFSSALQKRMELGIKQGFIRGIMNL